MPRGCQPNPGLQIEDSKRVVKLEFAYGEQQYNRKTLYVIPMDLFFDDHERCWSMTCRNAADGSVHTVKMGDIIGWHRGHFAMPWG